MDRLWETAWKRDWVVETATPKVSGAMAQRTNLSQIRGYTSVVNAASSFQITFARRRSAT